MALRQGVILAETLDAAKLTRKHYSGVFTLAVTNDGGTYTSRQVPARITDKCAWPNVEEIWRHLLLWRVWPVGPSSILGVDDTIDSLENAMAV